MTEASTDAPGCTCRLHDPVDPGDEWSDFDRKLVADVQEVGWHVLLVGSEEEPAPWWAFTVGLHHSFGVPDLVMTGLGADGMHHWLNETGSRIAAGARLTDGGHLDGILEGFTLRVAAVASGWGRSMFGYGQWFSRRDEPLMHQLVWPDPSHRMPWEPEATENCRVQQARLWLDPADHPSGPWTEWVEQANAR